MFMNKVLHKVCMIHINFMIKINNCLVHIYMINFV